MASITDEQRVSNLAKFVSTLQNYVGKEETDKLIELIGGEEKLKNATFSTTSSTGTAYNGSLIKTSLKIASLAIKINELYPEEQRANKNQIIKVALLSNIAKTIMFEVNDIDWEVSKRGIIYKYTEEANKVALRKGERSVILCMEAGISFTPEEFEAMVITDKSEMADDNYTKYFSTILSKVIRIANEMVADIYRERK